MMTRRSLLSVASLMALAPTAARAQMATAGVRPQPRGKFSGLPFHAHFVNTASAAGLRQPVVYGSVGHTDYILEAMGCGCAFFDYDNDGWLDVLLLTGRRFENTPSGATIRLYKNNRDGTFTDVSEKAGLNRSVWAAGVTIGDYNNDGFDDLFITCWGQNVLFRNNGNGTFTDVTKEAGLLHATTRFGTGCTWIDYDRDGKLDLFVSHYLQFDPATIPIRGKDPSCAFKGIPVNCGPVNLPQQSPALYRNNGDGTFTDVSEKSGVALKKPGYGLTAIAADLDEDGWPDIYVACDTSPSLFFKNNHDGTFSEIGLESGIALNEDARAQAGMGLGIGDFNLDGRLDIFKTHFSEDTPVLYENAGKADFRDVTLHAGLGVETRFVSWGAGMFDLDNDGQPDLFFATGMVYPEIEAKLPDVPYKSPCILFRNLGGGKFEELGAEQAGPGLLESHSARGVAFGDFDNDGDLDILIVNLNEPPTLLRNDLTGSTNHWLKVLLQGTTSNRSAIGSTVVAHYGENKRQAQAVLAQASYLSVNDRRLHYGLGAATSAKIEIHWPNGQQQVIENVAADQLVVIAEGKGIIRTDRFQKK